MHKGNRQTISGDATEHLKSLLHKDEAVYAVILSSLDGHLVSTHSSDEFDESRLAAMTGSCLALSEQIAQGARQNNCDFVIIQNENGYLVLKRVGKELVISSLARSTMRLGMLLSATRLAAEALESVISQARKTFTPTPPSAPPKEVDTESNTSLKEY